MDALINAIVAARQRVVQFKTEVEQVEVLLETKRFDMYQAEVELGHAIEELAKDLKEENVVLETKEFYIVQLITDGPYGGDRPIIRIVPK